MTFEGLEKLWAKNCLHLGISGDDVKSMWDQLVTKYSEPHRKYHTLEHVEAMLQTLREFESRFVSPASVYAAVFFHDAVYDALSTTNEQDSAEMAAEFLKQNSVTASVVQTVESLILATAAHLDEPGVEDADWFLDADLAILGSEPDRYAWYVAAIRHEYAIIPDDQFQTGRQRFLETILEAETIFRTDELRDRFEVPARSNLKNELDILTTATDWCSRSIGSGFPIEASLMFDCQVHGQPVPADVLGEFRDSTSLMADAQSLNERMQNDGYIFLRGVVSPASIATARNEVFGRLADVGEIAEPPADGIFTGRSDRVKYFPDLGQFWQSVSEGPALRRVTHGPEIQYVLDTLLGETARGYDFVFLRPGVAGRFTFLHYDFPFFSRGTKNVVTAWTAVGAIPTHEGALFVLENSHRFTDLIEPVQQIDYHSKESPQVQMMGDAVKFARSRSSRLLTANFEPGDVILFSMTTMHGSFDNCSPIGRTRLSVDVRWQPASEPVDERYFGVNPAGTTGIGYSELNGAKPLTEPWHTR